MGLRADLYGMSISVIGLDGFALRLLVGKAISSYKITQDCYIFPGINDQADGLCSCLENAEL